MATRLRTTALDPTDPANISPQERITEIAAILAAGMLRLRRGVVAGPQIPPDLTTDSEQNCLDECAETRLHGHRG